MGSQEAYGSESDNGPMEALKRVHLQCHFERCRTAGARPSFSHVLVYPMRPQLHRALNKVKKQSEFDPTKHERLLEQMSQAERELLAKKTVLQSIIEGSDPDDVYIQGVVNNVTKLWNTYVSLLTALMELGYTIDDARFADMNDVPCLVIQAQSRMRGDARPINLKILPQPSDDGQSSARKSDAEESAAAIRDRATAIAGDLVYQHKPWLTKIANGESEIAARVQETVVYSAARRWNEFISLIRQVIQLDGQVNMEESCPGVRRLPEFIRNAYNKLTSPERSLQLEEIPVF